MWRFKGGWAGDRRTGKNTSFNSTDSLTKFKKKNNNKKKQKQKKQTGELYIVSILNVLNLAFVDPEGDYIAFSSDEELVQALAHVQDGVFKIYIRGNDCFVILYW